MDKKEAMGPRILLAVRIDGTVEDISIFCHDHRERVRAFYTMQALMPEFERFETRAKQHLTKVRGEPPEDKVETIVKDINP